MTPEQHQQRIRSLQLQLHLADYGMGMPRDYQRVLELRTMLEQARKEAKLEAKRLWTLACQLRATSKSSIDCKLALCRKSKQLRKEAELEMILSEFEP